MVLGLWLIGLVTRFRELIHGGNAARRAMRPVLRSLGIPRSMFVATSGDAGYGLDNDRPWYTVHLLVRRSPELEEMVVSTARDVGYQLDVDRRHGATRSRHDPTSSNLVAERDGRTLSVTISRDGSRSGLSTPPAGYAFVTLTLSLPSVYAWRRG
jgi:hypothetical protein